MWGHSESGCANHWRDELPATRLMRLMNRIHVNIPIFMSVGIFRVFLTFRHIYLESESGHWDSDTFFFFSVMYLSPWKEEHFSWECSYSKCNWLRCFISWIKFVWALLVFTPCIFSFDNFMRDHSYFSMSSTNLWWTHSFFNDIIHSDWILSFWPGICVLMN